MKPYQLQHTIEQLLQERQQMSMVIHAAASIASELDVSQLPPSAAQSANALVVSLNALPSSILKECLDHFGAR